MTGGRGGSGLPMTGGRGGIGLPMTGGRLSNASRGMSEFSPAGRGGGRSPAVVDSARGDGLRINAMFDVAIGQPQERLRGAEKYDQIIGA